MSNVTPIYAQPVPVSYPGYEPVPVMWPWVIVIIILIIVIIILAIWVAIRFNDTGGKDFDRLTNIQNGAILSSSNSITGKWGLLPNEADKVTLYVSTDSLTFNRDGTVTGTSVPPASASGSNNQVSINALTTGTMYNAALVATGPDTNHYSIYGPVKVFTQETTNLGGKTFNILNINSAGGVGPTGTYVETTPFGVYTFNTDNSYLVKHDPDTSDPELILCRTNTAATPTDINVALVNIDNVNTGPNSTGSIPLKSCQWSYNDTPPTGVDGMNEWCLKAHQNTSSTNANSQILCLNRNGDGLNVVSPNIATRWYNPIV